MMPFFRKGPSGYSSYTTAEEVTRGLDGTGLTAIVTGATNGIGVETARVLALRGVRVVMGIRNLSAGAKVRDGIAKEVPGAKVDLLELDLSSMASVRKFASDFQSMKLPLNILINNAGIGAVPYSLSKDGIEQHFATNYLGHFLLTHLLLDNMVDASSKSGIEGRIVNVSSELHLYPYKEGIRFDNINDKTGYNPFLAYGQSKLANALHSAELSRRLKQRGAKVTANSLHPGTIATNIANHNIFYNVFFTLYGKVMGKSIQQGAATTCYVALHPHAKGVSGKFFSDCNMVRAGKQAGDEEMAKKLWDFSLNLINA